MPVSSGCSVTQSCLGWDANDSKAWGVFSSHPPSTTATSCVGGALSDLWPWGHVVGREYTCGVGVSDLGWDLGEVTQAFILP